MNWPPALTLALAVPLAWAIDLRFGEPRDAWHPVAWLGRGLARLGRRLRDSGPVAAFIGGGVVWLAGAALVGGLAWSTQVALVDLSPWLAVPALAVLLKPTFAWRMLRDEAAAVEAALGDGVQAARTRLAHLVSRDVRALDADLIRETTIETVAENLNDSLVAPLFWYALFGLPGAAVYRFANTLDAMWGYRGAWEWAGKWSARADDVLSWFPARLTALLLMPTPRLLDQARHTPSPNGGWPMGAMALRLGVRLRKPGVYELNGEACSPRSEHVSRTLVLAGRAALVAVVLVTSAWLVRAA
ncbi:MAG: adenosylcobinamide-phosphate synthase CbiB [Burkholderiales bacterium]